MKNKKQPDAWVEKVSQIDWAEVYRLGYRLVLCDVDNTLQEHGRSQPTAEAAATLTTIRAAGLRVAIFSNAKRTRAASLGTAFSSALGEPVPAYGQARKPGGKKIKQVCREFGVLPERTVLLGDQWFTDGLAGMRHTGAMILVRPYNEREPWYILLKRALETLIMKARGLNSEYWRLGAADGENAAHDQQ